MLRYTRTAERDLQRILEYLNERSPMGARNVARSIAKMAELIEEFPQGGRRSGEQNTRVVQAGGYPYLIYWDVKADDVRILHIRHAARRPWTAGEN